MKSNGSRADILRSINAPLGFFALSLLIVEALMAVLIVSDLDQCQRMLGVYLGIAMFIFVVVAVWIIVWNRPKHLVFDKEAHLEESKRGVFSEEKNKSTVGDKSAIQGDLDRVEKKILNTLWIKQVNRFGHWPEERFMFRVAGDDPDYKLFIMAGLTLLQQDLVSITSEFMFFLTDKGWEHCKQHHSNFGFDQWWPEEKIVQVKLQEVLKA